ncbi:hypothetical protein [Candidatus Methanoperedens nitratireducens]|uniref:Uncharacterized protein n=1 Tax=Candidatus Methanoperedens nitratireducens TaxID=1392998 RepID=A0A284VJX1_9EURY|nr:hypothetical protein [Candidatus Methanoperedens nitroreducens]SNQ59563.1 hypothetical protein MNV_1230004 [Candidatus Methanoperedens nitroreducens]
MAERKFSVFPRGDKPPVSVKTKLLSTGIIILGTMGVKSGCIVVAALILIAVLSGCVDLNAWRSGISEEENQKLPGQPDELKNNQSAVEKLKKEQAGSTPMPTLILTVAESTPTTQYTPDSITSSTTPAQVTTTPRELLIQTPIPTPTLAPTTTPVSTPAPISTPGNIWSFRLLSLSGFYHYIEYQ